MLKIFHANRHHRKCILSLRNAEMVHFLDMNVQISKVYYPRYDSHRQANLTSRRAVTESVERSGLVTVKAPRFSDLHFESVRVVEMELPRARLVEEAAPHSPHAHLLLEMTQIEVGPPSEGEIQRESLLAQSRHA